MTKKTKSFIRWTKLKSIQSPIQSPKYAGVHLLADFWYGKNIEDPKKLEKILIEAGKKANNTPLKVTIHKFSPHGITGVLLLAESHIALHSWPEINYCAIDIFTCGKKTSPQKALAYFKKILKPKKINIQKMKRGVIY